MKILREVLGFGYAVLSRGRAEVKVSHWRQRKEGERAGSRARYQAEFPSGTNQAPDLNRSEQRRSGWPDASRAPGRPQELG